MVPYSRFSRVALGVSDAVMRCLVRAVGIEFAAHLISPADSFALVSALPPKMRLRGRVLWPRCGQLPHAKDTPQVLIHKLTGQVGNLAKTTCPVTRLIGS